MKKKVAVYTALISESSILYDPSVLSDYCDYICFTNQPALHSSVWQMRPFPENGLDNVRKEKQVKILAHKMLPEYPYTIWIDHTVEITDSLDELIEEKLFHGDCDLYAPPHPRKDCIYTEAESLLMYGRDRKETVAFQMKHYKEQLYPEHNGLSDTSILLRNHHSPKLNTIMEQWWEEIATYSFLDQLSFDYITWKNTFMVELLPTPLPNTQFCNHHSKEELVF